MNRGPNDLLNELSNLIAEGLESVQLSAGANAVVYPGPITVVAPTPEAAPQTQRQRSSQNHVGFYAT